ncbi:MAG: alpha/beta fold hydrolase [Synergistaceae bacterium]
MPVDKSIALINGYNIHISRILRGAKKTIAMVNGAMSTTASFHWAISNLRSYNLILFDYPCTGLSKDYNPGCNFPSRDVEAGILSEICGIYRPEYLCSMSWGGASSLISLAEEKNQIEKAVIAAFSFGLTEEMRKIIQTLYLFIEENEMKKFAHFVNDTLGKYLPSRVKEKNYLYLSELSDSEIIYLKKHFDNALAINEMDYVGMLEAIRAEVLFINGSLDLYTSPESISDTLIHIPCSKSVNIDCGHFMAMEDKKTAQLISDTLHSFFPE